MVDKLLVITCNNEIQISRIQKRDNCTREEAIVRINSQISQEEKVKYADYIIDNSGSIESLGQKVNEFLKEKCKQLDEKIQNLISNKI